MQLGPAEILVILVVALLVFGPNKLPEIGRQVGRAVREFRKFQDSLRTDLDDVLAHDARDHAEPPPGLQPLTPDPGASESEPESQPTSDSTPPTSGPPTGS